MGRALLPQQDAREGELPAQGPPWRAGGPALPAATLRVLILALLWRGKVPQSVSVQEGLCILVPCTFMYPTSYKTDNSWARLYRYWYKDQADVVYDPPMASTDSSRRVPQETQGRFQLAENPAHGDCSLQISDARQTDAGRYFFRFEKGTHRSVDSPQRLTEEPEIQISPARGLPGTLLVGEPVTVTCTSPGRCSGTPPRVTWTGPFSDTARDVSAQLANGTWAHSSALSFTPGLGDHGKELVCTVTYSSAQGPSTSRTIWLHIVLPAPLKAESDIVSLETQEGDSLSLNCEAGSRAGANLSWAKGNESLSSRQGGAGRLELPNLTKNFYGSASRALRVHVQSKALGGAMLQAVSQEASGGRTGLLRERVACCYSCYQIPAPWWPTVQSSRPGSATPCGSSAPRQQPPCGAGLGEGELSCWGCPPHGGESAWLELPNMMAEDRELYRCWAQKESSTQGTFQLIIEIEWG
uniref:Ig-like domain-containing protein n=1 Tax=Terrapene triunguis TaxID=2587831 RepID=A0A674JKA1_9SAUR